MKVLYAGTPAFALPGLEAVRESSRHELVGILTMPDRPKGRGRKLSPPPVKERGIELGLPVLQPAKPSSPESLEAIERLGPDVIAVVAYGRILRVSFLALPRHGCVNLHASLLPGLRGAAPIERAIQRGMKETGVTTMMIDRGLDTGDMLLRERTAIGPDETAGELAGRLALIGAPLLAETLDRLEKGDCPREPQDHGMATHAPPIGNDEAVIDWTAPAPEIVNLVRAMNPRPVARTETTRGALRVYRAEAREESGRPGTVLVADPKGGLVVAAGAGSVRLREIQLPGRKRTADGPLLSGVKFSLSQPLAGEA